jgi:hypothetical protein
VRSLINVRLATDDDRPGGFATLAAVHHCWPPPATVPASAWTGRLANALRSQVGQAIRPRGLRCRKQLPGRVQEVDGHQFRMRHVEDRASNRCASGKFCSPTPARVCSPCSASVNCIWLRYRSTACCTSASSVHKSSVSYLQSHAMSANRAGL